MGNKKMNRLTFGIIVLGVSSACLAADDVRPQKYAYAVRAEAAPAVDGKLDDAVWKTAEWNGEYLAAKTGAAPVYQTRFKAAYTKDALYLAVESLDDEPAKIDPEVNVTEWWHMDIAEVFIANLQGEVLHLVESARGNMNEEIPGSVQARNESGAKWRAASAIGTKSWTCEFAIPFGLLGFNPGDRYATIPFNISRCIERAKQYSLWNFTKGRFGDLSGFGRLAFVGRKAPAVKPTGDELTFSCWARLPALPKAEAGKGRTSYALLGIGNLGHVSLAHDGTLEGEISAKKPDGGLAQFITRAKIKDMFEPGEWCHYAVTYSPKSGKTAVWFNGNAVAVRGDDIHHTTKLLPIRRDLGYSLRIGSHVNGYFPTDGQVAGVKFHDRALTAEELSAEEDRFWRKLEPTAKSLADLSQARHNRKVAEADKLFNSGRTLRYCVVDVLGREMFKWDTALKEETLDKPVKIVSAKGEYEAAGFLVRSKFDVRGFIPTPSDLRNEKGDTLPASVLDLRIAKVMARYISWSSKLVAFEPVPLVHDDAILRVNEEKRTNEMRYDFPDGSRYVDISTPMPVGKGHGQNARYSAADHPIRDAKTLQPADLKDHRTIEYFITSHVPADAKPGVYRGEIALKTTAGESYGAVPVELTVLPFALPEPMTRYDPTRVFERGIYHRVGEMFDTRPDSPGTITQRGRNERQVRAEMRNMAAHGIQHPCICMGLPMPYWKGDPSCYNPKNGGTVTVPDGTELAYFRKYIAMMKEEGLSTDPLYVFNNGNLGFRDHYDRRTMKGQLEDLSDKLRAYLLEHLGHTNVWFYGVDEASGDSLAREYDFWEDAGRLGWKFYTTVLKQNVKNVAGRIEMASVSWAMTKEIAKYCHDRGTRVWSYANPQALILGQTFPFRVNYGMGEWLGNFDGFGVYAYNESNFHPWNDVDGVEWSYVFQTADGVVDCLCFEGQREAVDDVRYATLLARLCRENPSSPVAQEALAWLDVIDVTHFSYDPNATRAKMVRYIMNLLENHDKGKTK